MDSKLWQRNQEKDSYQEYVRDSVKLWDCEGMKYILDLEPEDSPHFTLPVKYMNYESVQYDRQCRQMRKRHRQKRDLRHPEYLSGFSESDCLMPVITIGIYLGREEWAGHMTLGNMAGLKKTPLEIRDRLVPFYNDFHVNLWDIHKMEAGDTFRTDLREVFGFLKRQDDKEALKRYVEENEAFRHLREDAYDVVAVYSRSRELEIHKEEYEAEEGFDMCLAIQEMIEDGKKEGWLDGISAMNELIHCLMEEGRTEDLLRSSQDLVFQEKLMEEYGICKTRVAVSNLT